MSLSIVRLYNREPSIVWLVDFMRSIMLLEATVIVMVVDVSGKNLLFTGCLVYQRLSGIRFSNIQDYGHISSEYKV